MKKQLFSLVMMLLPMVASAHDIEVRKASGVSFYYNYINDGNELEVTFRGTSYDQYSNEYTGKVLIPDEVNYMSRTLKVTRIGVDAFAHCTNITSITIPNSVTSISDDAFYKCSGLTSITIPNSVTSIGDYAFYCSGLTSITIPNSVTSIGDYAFESCKGLTSVTIGDSVTSIGDYAFKSCSGLTSITIPNSVTSIGDYAFYYCFGLTSVTIGDSVTSIGDYAFKSCSGLTSITIPNSVTSIGRDAFNLCNHLQKVIVPDIAAWCSISFNSDHSNPLLMARHIYSDENTEIKNLVIPNSVTKIGDYAFCWCDSLTSVTIGDSVTSIGDYAFRSCKGLTSITIPNSVTSIGNYAFYYCFGLTSITIPNSVTSIGDYAFESCKGLTSITIPNSVTSIGDYAFCWCDSLTSVTIGNSVTSIGREAFSLCFHLQKVIVPDIAAWCNISFNGDYSNPLIFAYIYSDENTEIKDLVIPNSVTSIGDYAFLGCTGLTSVTIPESVTKIGEETFRGCSRLNSVTIPNSVTKISDYAFESCKGLTSVTIPESVTKIGEETFRGCSRLNSVTIPNSVTKISDYAFESCKGLTSITIGNSVTSIGESAFSDCGLEEVKVLAETPPFAYDNTFSSYDISLYVPESAMYNFQTTSPWSKFASFKTLTVENIEKKKCATPIIQYNNGQLAFSCETEDVVFNSSIKDSDIKDYKTATIQLGVTYNIQVYASKKGYENSEVATATLCWIDAAPQTEGVETGVAQISARPVLVKTGNGLITVEGADDQTDVRVYTTDGKQAGTTVSHNNTVTVVTSLQPGSIAIVKVGEKRVKVIMK